MGDVTTQATIEEAVGAARAEVAGLEVGEGVHWRDLTLFPLRRERPVAAKPVRLLAEAIAAGEVEVREVGEGGEVPWLELVSTGSAPVLLPEGEVLSGAKQDRVVNVTLLVAAAATTRIPVSCVEAGRWAYRTRRFAARSFAHPRLRSKKAAAVRASRAAGRGATSDQGAVWADVDTHLAALQVASPTSSALEAQEAVEDRLTGYRERLVPPPEAEGVLVARGDEVLGLDLFDHSETLAALWPRLATGYFVQAAEAEADLPAAAPAIALNFVQQVAESLAPATGSAAAAATLGVELDLAGDELAGSGLWHDGVVVHLAAFPAEAAG